MEKVYFFLVCIKWVPIEADQKFNHFRVMLPCLLHLCHMKKGHKKHCCDIILMISLSWLHVLFITESFHVSIISPNCCYISILFVSSEVCVWPSFFHKRCLWSQHTFHNKSIINPRQWLVLTSDWCSQVGMYLEKANVGLGFFLWIDHHLRHGQIASTWNHHVQCFFLTKIVVFCTKKIGNDLWN